MSGDNKPEVSRGEEMDSNVQKSKGSRTRFQHLMCSLHCAWRVAKNNSDSEKDDSTLNDEYLDCVEDCLEG